MGMAPLKKQGPNSYLNSDSKIVVHQNLVLLYSRLGVAMMGEEASMALLNREYKDRLFTFIFGREENREWTLSLYNAINGSHHTDASAIKITTLPNVIYMGMHNDVSFIIANELNLYEQQSSFNPNMPVRQFLYAAKLIEQYLVPHQKRLYWSALVRIPAPKLLVLYNGKDTYDDETILRLSDAYFEGTKGDIEATVRMLNINYGRNKALAEGCKPLQEYAWIVDRIRAYAKEMSKEDAVDKTISEMSDTFILKPFLLKNKAEVKGMILTEFNEVEHEEFVRSMERAEGIRLGKEEGRAEGRAEGRTEALVNLMKNLSIPLEKAAALLNIPQSEYINYQKTILAGSGQNSSH